ncbi:hypothetical protein LTS18_005547, partial [Coniosporium uncinatum]
MLQGHGTVSSTGSMGPREPIRERVRQRRLRRLPAHWTTHVLLPNRTVYAWKMAPADGRQDVGRGLGQRAVWG